MQFTPISRADIPKSSVRESKVSTALFNGFLESGAEVAKIELEDSDKKLASVRSTLQNYVKRHELNIKVFTRGSDLYLERLPEGTNVAEANDAANAESDELANA